MSKSNNTPTRANVTGLLTKQLAAVAWQVIEELRKRDLSKMNVRELLWVLEITSKFALRPGTTITLDGGQSDGRIGRELSTNLTVCPLPDNEGDTAP